MTLKYYLVNLKRDLKRRENGDHMGRTENNQPGLCKLLGG